jgi:hypothetical protein
MLFSLVGTIFRALKGWVIWWCWGGVGVVLGGAARGKDGREADFCCKVDESPFGARTSPSTRVQKWLPRPTVRCQFILFGVHSQVASSRCMKNHPVLHGK